MRKNQLNDKLLSGFGSWSWIRFFVASVLLAATTVGSLWTILKLIYVLLAVLFLLVRKEEQNVYTQTRVFEICFAVAIGMITICSKSSFLYPMNDWVDANCFFTVGKSMMNGVVVYRDLLEQKGPFLYFLHGLAWLISHDSFAGVYLFEILAATFFLYYSHRGIELFITSSWTVFLIPVYAAAVYTCDAFRQGDSVEELALPVLAYALWLGMDAIHNQREITRREFFTVGLTAGLIFWSKFTVVGFYVGWYLFPAVQYIRRRDWKSLGTSIVSVFWGVAAATLPFVIYFGIHGAISDWLTVYLYDNLFTYSKSGGQQSVLSGVMDHIWYGAYETQRRNPLVLILGLLALLYLGIRHTPVGIYYIVTAVFALIFAFVGGVYYPYYSFTFNLFLPYGLIPIINILLLLNHKGKQMTPKGRALVPLCGLLFAVSLLATPNNRSIGVKREEMPQYQFAAIIGEDDTATLLNYGFLDGGFYTASNIVPNCRVFCLLNISPDELRAVQDSYIERGAVEYIVTRSCEITDSKYQCISVCEYPYRDEIYWYFLYRRV